MNFPIAIVGGGKVARDQHMPAIAASPDFTLAAAVTLPQDELPGVPNYRSLAEMKSAMSEVHAVALCTPPHTRHALALSAIEQGLDILNEKPPASSITEARDFATRAEKAGLVLYQSWHSREAAAVAPARSWLRGKRIHRIDVIWKEDVRIWHPGQEWIWEAGFGVFDLGINALSILSEIMPAPLRLQQANLHYPANRDAPVAADLIYSSGNAPIAVALDFDERGLQVWDIEIDTEQGTLKLSLGGAQMDLNGASMAVNDEPEYTALYRRFAELLRVRQSDAEFSPLAMVEEAFLRGARFVVGPFSWQAGL